MYIRNKIPGIATAIILSTFLFWISCINLISPGYVGVLVNNLGDNKGVESQELGVGIQITAPWKTIFKFPTFEQNDTWEGEENFNFQTSEGMAISADVGITYHVMPESVHLIFQKYRRPMHEISHLFIRNNIRDAINKAGSKYKIEDLYGKGKEDFFEEIETHVKKDLSKLGIDVTRIYLIGRFIFPENVIKALNSKIEANQRAQQRENELREAEAEAKKQIASAEGKAKCSLLQAKAEAEANNILARSVSSDLIKWQSVQKWDGKLSAVTGSSSNIIDISNFTNEKK